MLRTRLASASALLAVVLASSITPASAASGTTRWVDDDGHAGASGCGSSAVVASTIQAAVTASGPDDTVVVCPGTYEETVRIHGQRDGLTLRSSTPFAAVIKTPASMGGFAALVFVDHVDHVTVSGFRTIARTQAPCDDLEVAFAAIGSRDVAFRGNRVLAPGSGTGADCLMGVGIGITDAIEGSAAPHAASGTFAYNEVRDAAFASIIAIGQLKSVNLNTVHNSIRAYFGDAPAGGSSVSDVIGGQFGIAYLGHARGVVRDNVIQGATSAPTSGGTFYAGIGAVSGFDETDDEYRNGPIDIRDNLVRRVVYGVYLESVEGVTLRRNDVSNAYVALQLDAARDNTIAFNSLRAKAGGLSVDPASTGNTLRGNSAAGTGGNCLDTSSGTGTAGTANTWIGNTATVGASPSGICSTAP